MSSGMQALASAAIYLGPFVLIGVAAKVVLPRWLARRSADLADINAQAGPQRSDFILGVYRGRRGGQR